MFSVPDYLSAQQHIFLSQQQREAVEAPVGRILLLAVPGAGKTTVLTSRVAHLLKNTGADPRRILVLTFNRESAKDMLVRWNKLFDPLKLPQPRFSTVHSFCFHLLRDYASWKGSKMPTLLEGEKGGRERLLSSIYRELTGEFIGEEQLNRLSSAISYTVNMGAKAVDVQARFSLENFARLYQRYIEVKRNENLMDFDDMLLFSVTALKRYPVLLQRTRQRYDHILVDEAQDISKIQYELLKLLTEGSLFLVGDEDQSIYGFRGAYPQGMLEFFETFPDGHLMKLEENYRSTSSIVSAADKLIRHNSSRYPKAIFTSREEGEQVRLYRDCTLEQEYEAIAQLAIGLSRQGSCAVLYRSSYTGMGVARILRKKGIPYSASESKLGYGADFITRDISALLRLALDPSNPDYFRRAYPLLGCGISRETVQRALEEKRDSYLRWIVDHDTAVNKRTGKMLYTDRMLQKMRGKAPEVQIRTIVDQLGYLEFLERRDATTYQLNSYILRLILLRQLAEDFHSAEQFLLWLPSAEQLLGQNDADAAIRLSTVHSAKGQEFDHVIIGDALEGIFPAKEAVDDEILGDHAALEEETRLFYTAMTRAKNTLSVFAPCVGMGYDLLESRCLPFAENTVFAVNGKMLRQGMEVAHVIFGTGSIEEINLQRKTFSVHFRHVGKKTFGFDSLERKDLFELLG